MIEALWIALFAGFVVLPLALCVWERRRGALRIAGLLGAGWVLYAVSVELVPALLAPLGVPRLASIFGTLCLASAALVLLPCHAASGPAVLREVFRRPDANEPRPLRMVRRDRR